MDMKRRDFIKTTAAAGALAAIPFGGALAAPKLGLCTVDILGPGGWVRRDFLDIKTFSIFRVILPDGSIRDKGTEYEVAIALQDARREAGHYAGVKCESFTIIGLDHPFAGRIRVMKDGEQLGGVRWLDMRERTGSQVANGDVPDPVGLYKWGETSRAVEVSFDYIEVVA